VIALAAMLVAATSLQITVWPNGREHSPKRAYTLTCAPLGGTLPHRRSACTKVAALQRPFAPTPRQTACSQIYGGPQEAFVVGHFRGRRIRSSFNRRNGCEIDRWNRVAFLFPQ
jgi:hypothetical protein